MLATAVGGLGCGEERPAPERVQPVRVAALGDSIIEGFGSRPGFRNCGVFGALTDEIAQGLEECARGAGILVVQGGINDIANGRSVASAAENLQSMVRRGKELVPRVVLADVLPWNNGHPQADPQIADLNRRIRDIARAEGVRVLPFHATLEDPQRPGTMKEEWTDDGSHPSDAGYALLSELIDL